MQYKRGKIAATVRLLVFKKLDIIVQRCPCGRTSRYNCEMIQLARTKRYGSGRGGGRGGGDYRWLRNVKVMADVVSGGVGVAGVLLYILGERHWPGLAAAALTL